MSITSKKMIDRNSAIPLYKQIKHILIEELREKDGEQGRPFSTEQELTHRFHVSRAPVRQALKELADEGYVYRERAKGTFPVQEVPVRPPGLELGGLVSYLREQGMDSYSKILDVKRLKPSEDLMETLRLKTKEPVLKISRLILVKKQPIVWTTTYLSVPDDFEPTPQELEQKESVFALLESEQGIYISRGDHQLWAASANREEAKILKIKVGDPVLIMETKLCTRNDQLIGFRRAVHRAEDYKLSFTANR